MKRIDRLQVNGYTLPTKVAVSPPEQERGLMHQAWPPPIMAFPYDNPGIRKFWMKNTPSPLDIIFCFGGVVVGVYEGKPMSTVLVGPNFITDLVVELPKGMAERLNVKAGTDINILYSLKTIARKNIF